MSGDMFAHIRKLKGSDGQYIVQQPTDKDEPAQLWSKPIELSEVLPKRTDTNQSDARFIAFGDFNLAGVYGDRRIMSVKRLTEGTVNGINLADTDQDALQFTQRSGFKMVYGGAVCFAKTAA